MTLTDLKSIRVVELEPVVVEAARHIAAGEIPALRDPRVRLDFNDARNTLLVERTRYDLIVSQPSHPWLAGAANVFTRQFWEIVKSRLNERGVFGQWINLFKMDATTLRSLFQAFYEVFPQGMSFANLHTGDIIPPDNMPKCWRSRAISMRRGNHCGELSTQLCASPLTLNYRLKQMAEPFYLRWCASAARYPA